MTPELLATHQIIALFEKSKGLADQIFDELSGVFFHFDVQGTILRSNQMLAEILGIEHEDVLGEKVEKLFPQPGEFAAKLEALKRNPSQTIEFELPLETRAGGSRDYLWQLAPLKSGRQDYYTCIGRDISEVKSALAKVVTLAKDLELAEAMQNLLLPSEPNFSNARISMTAYYKSAAISGGDYWFYDVVSGNKIWILVADVTGHGAGAAMVTALVSGCIQTVRLAANEAGEAPNIPEMIRKINQNLMRIKDQPYWMTIAAVQIDLDLDTLTWWGAAAPPIFIIKPNSAPESFTRPSLPLGSSDVPAATEILPFPKGSRLFIGTDGVMERENESYAQFGLKRVSRALNASRGLPVTEARDFLINQLKEWAGAMAADDDITFVLLDKL